jgi:hypothetical protein
MSIHLSYRQEPTYLVVDANGEWTTDCAVGAIAAIHKEADARGVTRLLLDIRELSAPDTEITRFFTGAKWAEVFRYPYRAACVMQREHYNGFAENVAVNRGAALAVFHDEGEALAWLLQQPTKAGSGGA